MAKIYTDFQAANLMSFAKSFARLNGQPLDKSEIWYSLEEAQAYALTDAAYVGQILAVINTENGKVDYFGIQNASGELKSVGSTDIPEDIEATIDELNNLLTAEGGLVDQITNIKDTVGAPASDDVSASGIYKEIEEVENQLDIKANVADVYSKTETDNVIAQAVAKMEHLSRKIVTSIEDIQKDINDNDANVYKTIYLVPALEGLANDVYNEYMVIDGFIEKVGSWEVDLTNYVTNEVLTNTIAPLATKEEVAKKVDAIEGKGLSTNDYDDAAVSKLASIENGAQVNIINTVSDDFNLVDKHLSLKSISIDKITDLQAELNKKVAAKEGYTLLSPDDQAKLSALVIGDDNNLEVSGTVNADNVKGLDTWISENANKIPGLSENNFTDEMKIKLVDNLFISSVETSQMEVTNGHLKINAITKDAVTGLNDTLTNHISRIELIEEALGALSQKNYDKDIAEIKDILTWKDM